MKKGVIFLQILESYMVLDQRLSILEATMYLLKILRQYDILQNQAY